MHCGDTARPGAQYVATVLAVGTECDIACLTVKDDEFWEGTDAVTFGDLPHLQDSILVIGCATVLRCRFQVKLQAADEACGEGISVFAFSVLSN